MNFVNALLVVGKSFRGDVNYRLGNRCFNNELNERRSTRRDDKS